MTSTVRYPQPKNYPVAECVRTANEHIAQGSVIYQKFTCESCGSRQTMEEENTFYLKGKCEACGHTTDIQKDGCNYMLVTGI